MYFLINRGISLITPLPMGEGLGGGASWGKLGPVEAVRGKLALFPILSHKPSQPKVQLFLQTEKGPREAEGHITKLTSNGTTHLLDIDSMPNMVHDRQTMLAVG